ncbi:MAG: hypothetical protein KDE53_27485 [Caldilineaceae bacterium]|nr:hypothetical protein [Caldilineaceae bacterium]
MPKPFAVTVDGRRYQGKLYQQSQAASTAPRLVIVAYQPTPLAQEVLRVCIETIERYTPEPHELWVVDNNSPATNSAWLLQYPTVNLIYNQTEPIPPEQRNWRAQAIGRLRRRYHQRSWGSYANAIGLEIALQLIDPATQLLMPLHMDTMPSRKGWLSYLTGKVDSFAGGTIAAAGVRLDHARVTAGVLHVLGYLVDYQLFRQLALDFLPALPALDVGDRVTVALRQAGYGVFACRNTFNEPAVATLLEDDSPFKALAVDRALDDEGNVIFLHQGRGVRKSTDHQVRGVSTAEWIHFADEVLLQSAEGR